MKKILITLLLIIPFTGITQNPFPNRTLPIFIDGEATTKEEVIAKKINDPIKYDRFLMRYMSGRWVHRESVYPSGNRDYYRREFTFYSDSVWTNISITGEDTTKHVGKWFIMDTTIYLYTYYNFPQLDTSFFQLGDVVYIELLDEERMLVRKLWGEDSLRKTSSYIRRPLNK